MHVTLVTPTRLGVGTNPGCQFITAGIKWLIRQADSTALFTEIDLIHHDEGGYAVAWEQADVIVVCGNPRLNETQRKRYCDVGIWRCLEEAVHRGIPVVDLFNGAVHGLATSDLAEMANRLRANAKNQELIRRNQSTSLTICRDDLAYALLRNPHTHILPCSTWWAPAYWGLETPSPKPSHHALVIRDMPGYEWLIERFLAYRDELARERPTFLITHTEEDYWWCRREIGEDWLLCLSDPESLLQFYSRTDKLVSLRLHGTIPAAALGAQVANVHQDSRWRTLIPFGLGSVCFSDLPQNIGGLHFQRPANIPSAAPFVALWQSFLLSRSPES